MGADNNRKAARRRQGHDQRQAEQGLSSAMPRRGQLLLPLLQALEQRGGAARPRDLYDDVARRAGVPAEIREASQIFSDGKKANLWNRNVRHARQAALDLGYFSTSARGVWELTDQGRGALRNVRRGVIVTVFETDDGIAVAANVEDASRLLLPGSIDLLFTSPPFPLLSGKEYGTSSTAEWLNWMTGMMADWTGLLAPTGSIIMHLGEVYYRGMPVQSQYIERLAIRLEDDLGLYRAGRLYWENPSRLPDLQWAAIQRKRVRSTVDPLLWFSKIPDPKADNRRVLEPYAEKTKEQFIGKKFKSVERPGGINLGENSWTRDNGGRIPGSLVRSGNVSGMDAYSRACRVAGIKLHPARMPSCLAEFAIKLTTEPGDLVVDPFFGSGTTGAVAQALGRRWMGVERSLAYLEGAATRFTDFPGFRSGLFPVGGPEGIHGPDVTHG